MLTTESAEILCDYTVDFPKFDISHHSLESRTVKICSAPSIIYVLVHNMQAVFLCILLQYGTLCFNAYAVAVGFIVTAQP